MGQEAGSLEALSPILGGKPLIAMNFHDMEVRQHSAPATPKHAALLFVALHMGMELNSLNVGVGFVMTAFTVSKCIDVLQMSVREPTVLKASRRRLSRQSQLQTA